MITLRTKFFGVSRRNWIRKIYLEGMKYKDVADKLGISVATVNSILVRALKKLRQQSDNNDKLAIYLFFLEKSLILEQ